MGRDFGVSVICCRCFCLQFLYTVFMEEVVMVEGANLEEEVGGFEHAASTRLLYKDGSMVVLV